MLFTPAQLQRIREIILQHHQALIVSVFGADALPETTKAELRAAGVPIPEGPMLLEDAYAYGQLLASLLQPTLAEETPEQVRARIEAHPIPTTPIEDAAMSAAANHAAQYVTGLAGRVTQDVVAGFAQEEDALTPDTIKRVIADNTERGIERREATERIKSNLGHSIQNWTRDWLRIATTEVNDAIQSGTASVIGKEHGGRARVSKVPRPDACADCKRLYLDDDGNPKIFFLDELIANGSNVGRHKSLWKPVIGSTHPWCACVLVHVPWGLVWKDGELVVLVSPEWLTETDETLEDVEETQRRNAAIVEGLHAKITEKAEKPMYIGPKGGRWANPQHTEHWTPSTAQPRGHQLMLPLSDEERQDLDEEAHENGVDLRHYFASGSNHSGEIEGFAQLGWNVGVAAPHVNHQSELALMALKGKGTKVFVDSGAFSEIGFNPAPYVKEPITDDEWTKRLDLYDRLATHLGPQLYAVAPDKVAFQADTYERLKRYAPRIQALAAKGANILVPLQKGELSIADFDRKVENLLGIDFIRAIPMKKDATSTADFEDFLRERRPRRIHLLGLGEKNERLPEVMAAVRRLSPQTEVFLDSVKITSAVERPKLKANGKMSRPRKLTAAQDRVRLRVQARAFSDDAYTESIGSPSSWLSAAARDAVAKERGLSPADAKAFKKDPTAFIHSKDADGDLWTHDPILMYALDHAWADYYAEKGTTVERKRESIKEVFGGKKLMHLKTRDEAIQDAVADEQRPVHRKDAEQYRWETKIDAEGAHREAIAHAVRTHEMTPKEYAKLHEPAYGDLQGFLRDPSRGEWAAGQSPLKKSVDLDAFVSRSFRAPPPVFVGPRGGRYSNAEHTESYRPPSEAMHDVRPVDVPSLALEEYDNRVQLFGATHRNPQAAEEIRQARAKADGGTLHLSKHAMHFLSTELRDSLKVLSDPHLALEPHSQYLALALRNAIQALNGGMSKGDLLFVGPLGGQWADPAHSRTHKPPPPAPVHGKRPKVDIAKLLQGNLGVPRMEMPQIAAALLPDFISELQQHGIHVSNESVPVHTLKATQNELKASKIQSDIDGGNLEHLKKPVIVSDDDYLLDGHHRWAARTTLDPSALQDIVRVHLPIRELLKRAHAFGGVEYRKSLDWIEAHLAEGFSPAEVLAKAEGIFDSPRLPRRMLLLGNEESPRPEPGEASRVSGLVDFFKPKRKKKRKAKKRAKDNGTIQTMKHSLTPRAEGEEKRNAREWTPQTLIQNREAYNDPAGIEANRERFHQRVEELKQATRGIVDAVRKLPRNP